MSEIIPAILAQTKEEGEHAIRTIEHDCTTIQIDVLDGTLYPHMSWFDAKDVTSLNTPVNIELHLMVENPIPIIEAWHASVPTLKCAVVSAEMHRPLGPVIDRIHALGLQAGVAINPETSLHVVEPVIHHIDQLTLMSVHPGMQGQSFGDPQHVGDPKVIFDKIQEARNHRPDLTIEIDGGVREDLLSSLVQAGVNRIVVGSLIFHSEQPTETLQRLNAQLKQLV